MFYGENLLNLRIMNGLSRKQLAEKLEVTEQAVWQYENNYTSPKIETIQALKQLFHVKSKYFYREDILQSTPKSIHMMHIAYRSKMLHTQMRTLAEAKHVEFLEAFINSIATSLRHPTAKIVQLREAVIHYLNTTADLRLQQIEHAAEIAREHIGLEADTNDNLAFLIEKSGVFMFEKPIGEEIDAYSLWTAGDRSYIMLGNMKRSAVRRNFDIAHELGHLLLHYKLEFASLDRITHKEIEKEANHFASCFLLPKNEFKTEMNTIEKPSNPDAYCDLKKKWLVSMQVLGYRAAQLGIMDSRQHRNFYAALHRKGYLKREPLDQELVMQKPAKVKAMIDFAVKQGLVDLRKLLEDEWKVELPFLGQLTGIGSDFFEQYVQREHSFELEKVVEMPGING